MRKNYSNACYAGYGFVTQKVCCSVTKRLESEKTELILEVNKLHKEQEMWAVEKSELKMTLAEVSAENTQLRDELRTKVL